MASNGTKLSFSFGAPVASSSSAGSSSSSVPKSNMELLMAKSKSTSKPTSQIGSKISKKPSLPFGQDDDDDDDDDEHDGRGNGFNALAGPSSASSSTKTIKNKLKAPVGQSNLLSRSERKAQKIAAEIDQSIFDYDKHYDQMKSVEKKMEEIKKKESEERKPKYIENFLASANTRKLDKLRAEEKMLQREREQEGDEFNDKEKFITENYKKQMELVKLAEQEEKKREEELRKTRSGPGLTAFYKSMLESSEAENAAAMAATAGPSSVSGQGPSLAIRPPGAPLQQDNRDEFDDEEEYDPLLAREAKETKEKQKANSTRLDDNNNNSGKQVEINDEGEIIDKRSLLKAGLNITKKPKPSISSLPNSLLTGQRSNDINNGDGPYKSRAVGTAATYSERMERERKRLSEQYKDEQLKKQKEFEENLEKEKLEAEKRKLGDNGDAEKKRAEAKERFLARKRQRELDEKNDREKKVKEGD
ncbi:uncharacterized protein L201_000581 [Kwoniella dendrophila CBS 6074]|uniref:Nuclear speckle splicing regulatory protein 1 N-terminal domain-containing protein n=1 Tax=Kwoniella dendrophila CBS 6074 TaxID=1295534 RepID=A0AAX4JMF8_9TREE